MSFGVFKNVTWHPLASSQCYQVCDELAFGCSSHNDQVVGAHK
jgi:hypothetical protein